MGFGIMAPNSTLAARGFLTEPFANHNSLEYMQGHKSFYFPTTKNSIPCINRAQHCRVTDTCPFVQRSEPLCGAATILTFTSNSASFQTAELPALSHRVRRTLYKKIILFFRFTQHSTSSSYFLFFCISLQGILLI